MTKGHLAAVFAAFSAGLLPIFTKLLMTDGLSSGEVMVSRYLAVLLIDGGLLLILKKSCRVTRRQFFTLIFLTIFGYAGACFLLATSFNFLPVGLATMLYFTYPLFTMLIMGIFFHEKPTTIKIVSLGLALSGIFCLMNFELSVFNQGSILALGAGLTYGIYLVGIRKSSIRTLDNLVIIFYLSGISSVFFIFQSGLTAWLSGSDSFMVLTGLDVFYALIMGGITVMVLGAVAYATKTIGPSKTALIIAFEAVVSLVVSILLFGEAWNALTVIGAALMTLSVIFMSVSK